LARSFWRAEKDTRSAAQNDTLPVFVVLFNPSRAPSRTASARALLAHLGATRGVTPYFVELAYEDDAFEVASPGDAHHLALRWPRGAVRFFCMEAMFNAGVRALLPRDWRAVAFVDLEVRLRNPDWAVDALRQLTAGGVDALQPFETISAFAELSEAHTSVASVAAKGTPPPRLVCHGFSWALSRGGFERLGGLFDYTILGQGDLIYAETVAQIGGPTVAAPNATAVMSHIEAQIPLSPGLSLEVASYVARALAGPPFRVGFVPGAAVHEVHSSLALRRYNSRYAPLRDYDPALHVTRTAQGLLIPSAAFPKSLADTIANWLWAYEHDGEAFPGKWPSG
jgi:hypothetical protein